MIKLFKKDMFKKPISEEQLIIQALALLARNQAVSH